MRSSFLARTLSWILDRPRAALAVIALVVAGLAAFVPRFELDVSAESLVLAGDEALGYYRATRARYGSDDFLIVTYRPREDLFARETLKQVRALRDRLAKVDGVEEVTSLLDVPLLQSPPVDPGGFRAGEHRLLSPGTDLALARRELASSPLYGDLVVSHDGRTTAMRIDLRRDRRYHELRAERGALRERLVTGELSDTQRARLRTVEREFRAHSARLAHGRRALIGSARGILEDYRGAAEIHLAGIPLIVSDMVGFVRHDLRVFGAGALAFIAVLLAAAFRRPRWVLLPLALCAAAGIAMTGFLGLAGWRVTVVSSNYVAVLLIVTLSLCVHFIVRYLELRAAQPSADQRALLEQTVRSKFVPSLFTVLTTAVAFASLTVSGIRPVIDFGWIMVIGVALALALVAVGFPAGLARLPPAPLVRSRLDPSGRFVAWCARAAAGRSAATLASYALLAVASGFGIAQLTVENRFVDYFGRDTAIHQGMLAIDRELGGSTPLDVVLDAPPEHRAAPADARAGFTARSYWLNAFRLDKVKQAHDYLESLPESGKVLSVATAVRMLEQLNGGPLDNFTLAVAYERLPDDVRRTLFDPFISKDGSQIRFAVRVYETSERLDRGELLARIRAELPAMLDIAPEQIHLTGMMVLYQNVLESLFRSQALTLGFVFVAVLAMFWALFRSARIAAAAIVPNLIAAALVLGLIGALGIPLDIMTITIAAITLGIGVDDTIHYTHRYLEERRAGLGPWAAIERAHRSTGRALVYTSTTIALGFSVFALSSFVPAVTFGLLTGFAMLVALVANLTLLPVLLAAVEKAAVEASA